MQSGFSGGVVIDYPHSTKAKKHFLCLSAGTANASLPQGLGVDVELNDENEELATSVSVIERKTKKRKRDEKLHGKARIINKKERQRRQGKETRPDSKYTGRSRRRF